MRAEYFPAETTLASHVPLAEQAAAVAQSPPQEAQGPVWENPQDEGPAHTAATISLDLQGLLPRLRLLSGLAPVVVLPDVLEPPPHPEDWSIRGWLRENTASPLPPHDLQDSGFCPCSISSRM